MDVFKKHRSTISGIKRCVKSKLVQRLVERKAQRLNKRCRRQHKKQALLERRNFEETTMNRR